MLRKGATPQVIISALKTLEQTGVPGAGVGAYSQAQVGWRGWLFGLVPPVVGAIRSFWQNTVANAQLLAEVPKEVETENESQNESQKPKVEFNPGGVTTPVVVSSSEGIPINPISNSEKENPNA